MLVFFLHGVATKDAGYSRQLEALVKEEFIKRDQPLPLFYASFWGNVLNQTGQIWNWIHQDLQDLKRTHSQVDVWHYANELGQSMKADSTHSLTVSNSFNLCFIHIFKTAHQFSILFKSGE